MEGVGNPVLPVQSGSHHLHHRLPPPSPSPSEGPGENPRPWRRNSVGRRRPHQAVSPSWVKTSFESGPTTGSVRELQARFLRSGLEQLLPSCFQSSVFLSPEETFIFPQWSWPLCPQSLLSLWSGVHEVGPLRPTHGLSALQQHEGKVQPTGCAHIRPFGGKSHTWRRPVFLGG